MMLTSAILLILTILLNTSKKLPKNEGFHNFFIGFLKKDNYEYQTNLLIA